MFDLPPWEIFTVCILGMHRSGTSCLAGSLQEAGLFLGDVYTRAPYNAKGNRENRKIMDLQEDILRNNQGSWDAPPAQVVWNAEHKSRRDRIISTYPSDKSWGFKDPRTLLTLRGWLEALSNIRFVGTFRHPLAVVDSLQARNAFSNEKSLSLWLTYNRLLLSFQREFGFDLVCFDWQPQRYYECVEDIVADLGLQTPASGFSFFDSALRKNEARADENLPAAVLSLYRELERIANQT